MKRGALVVILLLVVGCTIERSTPAPAPTVAVRAPTVPAPAVAPRRAATPPIQQPPVVRIPPGLPRGMTQMRERPNDPDAIAAWSPNDAFASTDGGATFKRVVHAPGEVRDVKFDVYGRMVILIASLPDGKSEILGDGPIEYVLTTAFDPASVL